MRADDAGKKRCIKLPGEEFIRRFLLHVLPKGIKRIRHYGLLASAAGVEEVPAPAGKTASPDKPGKKVMDEPAEMEEPAAESDDPFSDEPAPGEPMSKNKAAAKDVTDEDTAVEDDNAAAGQ